MSREPGIPEAVTAASAGTGAAFAGAVAACCSGPALAPVLVAVLGAGGAAWAAGLRPWSPYLLTASLGLLAFSFVRVRRAACPPPAWVSVTLWISAAVWLAAAVLVAVAW